MKNFWEKLGKEKKPFFCLAPMADVTDSAFRQIVAKYGKFTLSDGSQGGGPDALFTEMAACDGLCSVGKDKLLKNLEFAEIERPLVAQLFGSKPENFYQSARLMAKLGFDGIDINMGCPQKNILKQGAGADLIKHPNLAKEIIRAAKNGAGNLPVSIKTRIGFNKNEIEEWLPILLKEKPAVITIHGRTKKEMSKVPARWDIIKRGAEIAKGSGVLIIGNGDIQDIADGRQKAKESGTDGVMIGRAVLGNPWFFNLEAKLPSSEERLKVLGEHIRLFEKLYGEKVKNGKSFNLMKKHMGAYIRDFDGAKGLRMKLMEADSAKEAEEILKNA
ncbi:MAG: tRNA-dihydrouridine synthase [Candidatus Pacebacteria bacterium]|nr:tRNA-dihydrouridine synthase [Candidatus Paceibacterota bacterium]